MIVGWVLMVSVIHQSSQASSSNRHRCLICWLIKPWTGCGLWLWWQLAQKHTSVLRDDQHQHQQATHLIARRYQIDLSVCLSVTHAQLFYLNADQLLLHCITQLTPESRFQEKSLTNWTIGLPSRILGLDCTQWVLAFLSRSSIYAYFFAFAYKC